MSTLKESPTVWFWYLNLNDKYGHDSQCNYMEDYHIWIVHVMSFPVKCGMPHGSSRLGRYGIVNLEAPKSGQETPSWLQVLVKG